MPLNGRVTDLALDQLKKSRRRAVPASTGKGGDANALKAFSEQQDSARQSDAEQPTTLRDRLRSHNRQLLFAFGGLAFASAVLFLFASLRSARADMADSGYGLMLVALILMAVAAVGSAYTSDLGGSKMWRVSLAVIALGLAAGITVAPQFEVERCRLPDPEQAGEYLPSSAAACGPSTSP